MKKLSFIGLAAMTILFGACTNSEPFDPNGGGSSTDYTQPAGQGTESDPYNVSAALVHNMDSSEVWVKGYIVGQVAGADLRADAQFGPEFRGAVMMTAVLPNKVPTSLSPPKPTRHQHRPAS